MKRCFTDSYGFKRAHTFEPRYSTYPNIKNNEEYINILEKLLNNERFNESFMDVYCQIIPKYLFDICIYCGQKVNKLEKYGKE